MFFSGRFVLGRDACFLLVRDGENDKGKRFAVQQDCFGKSVWLGCVVRNEPKSFRFGYIFYCDPSFELC
jgi:hypothetical protein